MAARKKTTKKSTRKKTTTKSKRKKTAKKSTRKSAAKKSTRKKSTRKKTTKKSSGKKRTKRSTQPLDDLDERLDEIGRKIHAARIHAKYKAANAKDKVKAHSVQAKSWVKENPGKAVAGAAFVGWITSRLFRRKK